MNLKAIETLLLDLNSRFFSSDYLDANYVHEEDVFLRVVEERELPDGIQLDKELEEGLSKLGDVEWDIVQIVISYGGLALGSFLAIDLRSLDDEFGAIIPVPLQGDICPVAWAVSRAISHRRPFQGFTGDLGLAPGNEVTTWSRWAMDEAPDALDN